MNLMLPGFSSAQAFLSSGGWTLWVMFGVSVLVWVRLIERAYNLQFSVASARKHLEQLDKPCRDQQAKSLAASLTHGIPTLRTFIAALPLLGLLGTVAGMIEAFDALATFGHRDPRALSAGISHALVSTMVGLVASLVALYFEGLLSHRIAIAQRELSADVKCMEPFAFTPRLALRQRRL